jgi:hypothetical protein
MARVLLDENIAHLLRIALHSFIPHHEIVTASYAVFAGLKNGALLSAAEDNGFDVLVTGDKTLTYEQNMVGRSIAMVCLSAIEWKILEPNVEQIAAAIEEAAPGSFRRVACGIFSRPKRRRRPGGPMPT